MYTPSEPLEKQLSLRAGLPTWSSLRVAAAGLLIAFSSNISKVSGQIGKARDTTPKAPAAEAPSPESPRASVQAFLTHARAGRFQAAAAYMDVPASETDRAPQLAKQLIAVLDRRVDIDLDRISPSPEGNTADGLAFGVDQIATIPDVEGVERPVRISQAPESSQVGWRFNQNTVARIPMWYASLEDRWIRDHLPTPLLRTGWLSLLWWQWLVLPGVILVAALIGVFTGKVVRAGLSKIAVRTKAAWDDIVLVQLARPIAVFFGLLTVSVMLSFMSLTKPGAERMGQILSAAHLLLLFWVIWRLINVARQRFEHTWWVTNAPSSRALLPLGSRLAKVMLVALAFVMILSAIGYPVAPLITGLGLGGLAFALAAQKTVENLFGAFSIGMDQPFREGDVVKVEDFVGTVERIGLRSTRFRTAERTLISIPNGRLADMRLESYSARDRLRFATTLTLAQGTTPRQVRTVIEGCERILRTHPRVWPEGVVSRLMALSAASIDIEVAAWFNTTDWSEFQLIREGILLQIIDLVNEAGASLAPAPVAKAPAR